MQIMDKISRISMVLVAGLVLAASVAEAAELKVGWVSRTRILKEAPQVEAARKKLQDEFAPRERELLAMQKELQTLDDKLQKDRAVMSEAQKRSMERDILAQRRDLKRLQDEANEDFTIRQNEVLNSLQERTKQIIEDFARKNKFDLILSDGVVYTSKRIDITDEILAELKLEAEKGSKR